MGRKSLLLFGLLLVTAWLLYAPQASEPDADLEGDAAVSLHNRVWAQHMAKSERDLVQYVVFARKGGHQFGSAQLASRWRSRADGFRWRARKGHIDLEFPQEQQKLRVGARTWRCKGKAPKPFTACLELKRGDRKATYYSMASWKFGDDGELPDDAAQLAPIPAFDAAACDDCVFGTPRWFQEAGL